MFSFKRADITEIPAIQTIANHTWPQTYETILGKDQVSYMLDLIYNTNALNEQFANGQMFFIIYKHNNPVGFAAMQMMDDEMTCKLHKIYVLPDKQGSGVGSALLQFVINKARSLGAERLLLNVNRNNSARFFYEKVGFTIMEEKDIDIGNGYFMNDFIMELHINNV